MPLLRKLVGAGLLAGASGAAYVEYLRRRYPILPPSSYHKTPAMMDSYLDGQGTPEVVYARITCPSAAQLSNPRDAGVRTFFDAWALRAEGWLFGNLAFASPRPIGASDENKDEVFLKGFFQTVHKSPESVVLFWSGPGRAAPVLHHAAKGRIPQGMQVVSALPHPDGSGDLEIAYGCAQYREPYGQEDGPIMEFVHHTYMRYLLERMRANMQAEARRG